MATDKKNPYRLVCAVQEDHQLPLYCVAFCHSHGLDQAVFATVGARRATVYRCLATTLEVVQSYDDPNKEEKFYSCAWSINSDTNAPVLLAAGASGTIRIIDVYTKKVSSLLGHGNAVNDIRFLPGEPDFCVTASKDHSLQMWNIRTRVSVAIFRGHFGHKDDVLHVDFSPDKSRMVSCSMDNSIKIWDISDPLLCDAKIQSQAYDPQSKVAFKPVCLEFPTMSTMHVHRNYVDCVRYYGDLILSKSVDNRIVCWRPGGDRPKGESLKSQKMGDPVTTIGTFSIESCDIWYVRFNLDSSLRKLAVGNIPGQIYLWNLDCDDPLSHPPIAILHHPKCKHTVRQVAFSYDSRHIVGVCDDGSLWRYDTVTSLPAIEKDSRAPSRFYDYALVEVHVPDDEHEDGQTE